MEQLIGLGLRKEYDRAVCCHLDCLTYMLSTSWDMPGCVCYKMDQDRWEKYQQLQICGWYHSNDRKWRRTSWWQGEGEWKSRVKTIKKAKIMASSPITSWQIEGAKVGAVADFLFLGSKITAHSDCSHEIIRWLIHGRKAMKNLDNVLKNRDIILPTKVYIVKAMIFPVVIYGYESWTIKKAGHQRIDAFKLWCCRRLLRVPWTARRSNQSIWKDINSEYTLERLMLKLKFQYLDYLMWTADSQEKSLMLGNIEGRRRRGYQRMRWLDGITDAMDMNLGKFREMVRDRETWHTAVHGVTKSWTWLGNWTTISE